MEIHERFIVGIDDTDVPDIGGTGRLGRALVEQFEADGLGDARGVTSHQLLQHPKIPMTKRNSAIAVVLQSDRLLNEIEDWVVRFVRERSERGADPGVAILSRHSDMPHVLAFGRRCQQEVMRLDDADRFAAESNARLRAIGDGRGGTIGALAAAGLRGGGGDGRYVGLRGIRELKGRLTAGEIRASTDIAQVLDERTDQELDRDDVVDTDDWIRPRLVDGTPVLTVRRSTDDGQVWVAVDRKPADGD